MITWIIIVIFVLSGGLFIWYNDRRMNGDRDWLLRIQKEKTHEELINENRAKKLKKLL